MPQVKTLASTSDSDGIVTNQDGQIVDIREFIGRQVKRATRIGSRVVVHLVGAAPGELLVFQTPEDYEKSILRTFQPS